MQMLLSDVMIDSIQTALEIGKISFDGVSRDGDAFLPTHILFSIVVNLREPVSHSNCFQGRRRISHDVRLFVNHLVDHWPEILCGHFVDVLRLHAPATLKHRHHDGLVSRPKQTILWPLTRPRSVRASSELPAHVGFVNFNDASELR